MIKHALFVRLEAKPGKEKELAQFLQTGLSMAQQEGTTLVWFALQLSPSTFGIFDAFADEAGRPVHAPGLRVLGHVRQGNNCGSARLGRRRADCLRHQRGS
jgi:hypothetical protein